jgi:hypothetical protein
VFALIKSGLNAVITCKYCSPGPKIINCGFLSDYEEIFQNKCYCGKPIIYKAISRLIFYHTVVDIEFDLKDKVLNPKEETKTMHLEAKGREVIVIGNGNILNYNKFKFKMEAVVNDLNSG